jgi:hypothetical protein
MPMFSKDRCCRDRPGRPQLAQQTSVMYSCPGFPNGSDPFRESAFMTAVLLSALDQSCPAPYPSESLVNVCISKNFSSDLYTCLEGLGWFRAVRHVAVRFLVCRQVRLLGLLRVDRVLWDTVFLQSSNALDLSQSTFELYTLDEDCVLSPLRMSFSICLSPTRSSTPKPPRCGVYRSLQLFFSTSQNHNPSK